MTYDELYALSSPHLKHYRADLEAHDKAALEQHPGCPFLHWTRDMGTHIVFLLPGDEYPAKGERVPYLFGSVGRNHILTQVVQMASCFANSMNGDVALTLRFDGKRFHMISTAKALEIARDYRYRIEMDWNRVRTAAYA